MAGTLQPNEIHVGPAEVWMDVTPPATAVTEGTAPTWMEHTNGMPNSGVFVGATLGETVFSWTSEKTDIVAEQSMGILDKFISQQNATLTFTAEERSYQLMKHTFDNIFSVNDATRMGFSGGGGGTAIQIQYTTIFLSSPRKDIPGKYEILVAYKCVSINAMPLTYSRVAPSTYAVQFQCLPDTTRMRGDQIFQFSREKGAVATGATAGSPGTFTPGGSVAPANFAAIGSLTATPATAWTTGQYVVLGDSSHAHWDSSAWVVGNAP